VRPVRFAWLLPDLALVAACVTLFYCLFLFQGYQKLFRDSDAGWHIRTGERILASGELPRTDPYSFTRAGQPWFAWEGAADAAAGAVHRAAGLRGVALFYATIIAVGVWLWFRLHWALDGDFLLACAMAPLLLSTCNIHWLARPHVISWLFLLAAVLFAERARPPFRARHAAVIAAFTALWANVHASFFFAPLIALIYAAGSRKRFFLHAALISALAPLANPYGWHLHAHVFRYLADSALLSRIGEFQSFDFHTAGSGQIIAAVILGIAGGTLALTLKRYEHFVLAMLISVLALRSARALPLVALVLLPLANSAIVATLERDGAWSRFRAYSGRLRGLDARWSGLALAPFAVLAAFGLLRALPAGFPRDQFPVDAYAHIPAEARLFTPDKFGGYLIYRSNGARKVFFDGRSDLYGAEFLKQYGRMVQVRPGWREYWESFHFSHALLPNDYPLIPALEQLGWRPLYRDGTATLLARGGT
jgi:hypothetical protein